jgi:hypothetical protein
MISLFGYWQLIFPQKIKRTLHYHEAVEIFGCLLEVAYVCIYIFATEEIKYPRWRMDGASSTMC